VSSGSGRFSDVPHDAVAFNAVHWASEQGLVTGTLDGSFLPTDNMTRAQFALVLYRYAGSPTIESSAMFDDVDPSRPSYNAITWAHTEGIVTGIGENFLPDNPVTRAQMVLMLHRFIVASDKDEAVPWSCPCSLGRFSDKDEMLPVATEAMQWAVTYGVITGLGTELLPSDNITRAQVVLILHRYEVSRMNIGEERDEWPLTDEEIWSLENPQAPTPTLEDEFEDNIVWISFRHSYSIANGGKIFTPTDFPELDVVCVETLWKNATPETVDWSLFNQMVKLTLPMRCKDNVLNSISLLESRKEVFRAYPSMIHDIIWD